MEKTNVKNSKNIQIKFYQYTSFKIPRIISITNLREKCFGCGLGNKEVRELLIHNDGKFETCLFRGPFFIKKTHKNIGSFKTTIKMDQDPKTLTRILIHQAHTLPNMQLIVIDLK